MTIAERPTPMADDADFSCMAEDSITGEQFACDVVPVELARRQEQAIAELFVLANNLCDAQLTVGARWELRDNVLNAVREHLK